MHDNHFDHLETRGSKERESEQMQQLGRQIEHARKTAPAYRELLCEFDQPIDSREKLAKLPLTRKCELREKQQQRLPFAGLTGIGSPDLTHIFVSPGPIYEPASNRTDFWSFGRTLFAAGFRRGDLLHNCFSYHFTPAGAMVESGAHALGCTVIPAGTGNTELQVATINSLRPVGYVGTPSFLKIILDKGDELKTDLSSLKKALVSGEYLPPSLRDAWRERGIDCLQCYATADLGLIAYESPAREGMIVDERIILEIVRPGTGDPLPAGEVGELVITSLNPDYPLIRFATGDLSAVMPGNSPCGRTNMRIRGWLGRADQTTKIRGLFVHPSQVAEILHRHPGIRKGRLVVSRENDLDRMVLQCETAEISDGLNKALAETIRDICKLRGEVVFVGQGELPNDGKVIDDQRSVA
ncbi:phenylacetate--CoA ligase family protein [Desulfuromonas sp. TF]|uniref:phenylacetate--CoA ligase family protein n=1 Tax=Desulfuromonas sp. TF TaxID=1232410 RepID=UPI000428FA04|nr:AMP-binding protein [Desulfuromonas sp. TF]